MEYNFYETLQKYGLAISQNLHPSQTKKLLEALNAFKRKQNIYIKDPFVKIVFDMIVADLLFQEERNTK